MNKNLYITLKKNHEHKEKFILRYPCIFMPTDDTIDQ